MNEQEIISTLDLATTLLKFLQDANYDKIFILTDVVTNRCCLPLLQDIDAIKKSSVIVIEATDEHKDIVALESIWTRLSNGGATRKSLLLCLGGGMVTDIGGFAASTFKRGISFMNIPTTLLGMVDAAVGGKTGINFNGLKNEIGAFNKAKKVIIYTPFLKTLDKPNVYSGYAEMLKHGLLSNAKDLVELLNFSLTKVDFDKLNTLVLKNIKVKEQVVAEDPYEKGLRKALNLGHTVGHAFESLALHKIKPILHGYAVAWGIICELYLATKKTNFPRSIFEQIKAKVFATYGKAKFSIEDIPALIEYMKHDKKNEGKLINFTLLADVGKVKLNQTATEEEIREMLQIFLSF